MIVLAHFFITLARKNWIFYANVGKLVRIRYCFLTQMSSKCQQNSVVINFCFNIFRRTYFRKTNPFLKFTPIKVNKFRKICRKFPICESFRFAKVFFREIDQKYPFAKIKWKKKLQKECPDCWKCSHLFLRKISYGLDSRKLLLRNYAFQVQFAKISSTKISSRQNF